MMEKEGEGAKSLLSFPIPYTLILDAFSKGCSNFPNWLYSQIKPGLELFGGFKRKKKRNRNVLAMYFHLGAIKMINIYSIMRILKKKKEEATKY